MITLDKFFFFNLTFFFVETNLGEVGEALGGDGEPVEVNVLVAEGEAGGTDVGSLAAGTYIAEGFRQGDVELHRGRVRS